MEDRSRKYVLGHSLKYFDRIQVINLKSRVDRRREVLEEFRQIGVRAGDFEWFDAVKPADRGGFESIGARGCFLSHLTILQQSVATSAERVLILEDDVSFSSDFRERLKDIVRHLDEEEWDVFYGGGRLDAPGHADAGLTRVPVEQGIGCTHFVAFRGTAIARVASYLEAQLARPAGDPAGGPMHVDGSYSWARRELELKTLMALPEIASQRSSRSDIAIGRWWDRIAGLRELVGLARAVKNRVRA